MRITRKKIGFFEKRLVDFFRKAGREHLPWRPRKIPQTGSRGKAPEITAYEIWVSEIMLQQTQVSRVISYYSQFLKRFPNVETLARASWKEFLPYYEGLGYYARGRNMLKAATIVVSEYGGTFPRDKKALETLPGVGPYTAAAIMSFAYGDEHLAWDTNLKRVIGRFFFGGKHLIGDTALWEDRLQSPKKVLNAALMDFGSALCTSKPKCEACMLRKRCVYYREKGQAEMQDKRYGIRDKKEESINWKDARAYVFLHENHKKYFSSDKKTFKPFIMPSGCNTRAGIKKYFRETYGLSLAVRPPHRKTLIDGRPTLLVNAQILLGKPSFKAFSKEAAISKKYE